MSILDGQRLYSLLGMSQCDITFDLINIGHSDLYFMVQ